MFAQIRHCGFRGTTVLFVLALTVGSTVGRSAMAQGMGVFGGRINPGVGGNRGYYPYYGGTNSPGYNIYGNYGVYGYPGSGIEGGASNSGFDPGYGGYPSYGGYGIANGRSGSTMTVAPKRLLGIDEEPVVLANGVKAMKVGKVFPGTAAERAGLQAGDVIRSVNGYLTEQRGNLAWVIANAMPNNELKLTVQTAKDGQTHELAATLR